MRKLELVPQSDLVVVHEPIDSANVVHVFADIDIASAPEFETEIKRLDPARRVVIDLLECRYIDSSALTVLIRTFKARGNLLRIAVASGSQIMRIFRLVQLDRELPIVHTLEHALASGSLEDELPAAASA